MDEKLNVLLEIQSVDIRLDEIKREKRRIPVGMEKLEEDFNLLKAATERDQMALKELKDYMKKTEN
ncbi:MAG: hypothetical protein U9R17_00860, partial [Thermodesulfobacteriota bacterium]|nr:hypothetical protein [Thermodesulfobacteriota bacterium]